YHLMWPYLRSLGLSGTGPEYNFPLHVEILARAAGRRDQVRWLIAGSADAGVLAAAEASAAALPGTRHDFVVVDRCETPLVLCRDHAAARGLSVETIRADLMAFSRDDGFDMVVMHHLLRFFDDAGRSAVLARAAGWLAPGGRLCVTVSHEPPSM